MLENEGVLQSTCTGDGDSIKGVHNKDTNNN